MAGVSLYLARRLSLSQSGHKSAPAVKVAVAAVAISMAVMIASISIVTGFKQEIRQKVTGFNSHITLYSLATNDEEDNVIAIDPALQNILDSQPFITSYNLEVSMPAILKTDSDFKGIYMKGFGPGADMSFLKSALVSGRTPDLAMADPDRPEILISQEAADRLGLKTGDHIDVYFITDNVRVRRMYISGIYNSRFDRYDNVLAFCPASMLQQLAEIGSTQGTSVRIMTSDFDHVTENAASLQQHLAQATASGLIPKTIQTETALVQGANYFQWLNLLDTNVVVILVLMTIVACVTLISGMLIIMLDKIRFIGVMKALGMSNRSLRRVFIYLSLRVALVGIAIGYALMLTLLVVQDATHFIGLDPDNYYLDYVPVSLDWGAFALLGLAIMAVIFAVLVLPSHFVASISPARIMHDD